MKNLLTVTRKGQTTLPVALRRQLGLGKDGGHLQAEYDKQEGRLIISPALTLDELSERTTGHLLVTDIAIADIVFVLERHYKFERQAIAAQLLPS